MSVLNRIVIPLGLCIIGGMFEALAHNVADRYICELICSLVNFHFSRLSRYQQLCSQTGSQSASCRENAVSQHAIWSHIGGAAHYNRP